MKFKIKHHKIGLNAVARVALVMMLFFSISNTSFSQVKKRFKEVVFENIDSTLNIQYGEAVNMKGKNEKLLLDFFAPANDSMKKRPLMIFIHGGGFQNNTKTGSFSSLICVGLAKRGYVSASIDYRLGIEKPKNDTNYFEAMYRAVQDAKAAVRFFRKNGAQYGVDTSQIFIMGGSAGAKTAMHLAYLSQNEIPSHIDVNKLGLLEGISGNEGFSSKVSGVVNCWGALINYKWMNKGDAPLFNVAGTADKTVPYDSSYDYHGFKYGAMTMYHRALSLGIPTGYRPFVNTGHTLDNNKVKQDSALQDIAQWLYTRLAIHAPNKPEVLKWEDEIQGIEKRDATNKPAKKSYLFIGSSYIRLWTNLKEDIQQKKVINHGFGGSKLSDVAYYIDRLIAHQNKLKGIVLYVGNDITGSNLDKTPEQDLQLVKYITQKIRIMYPKTPIYWCEISPSEKRWAVWNIIQQANQLIKSYCLSENDLHFIESSVSFLNENGTPKTELFRDDKLHYNLDGYKVWGSILKKKL
jgi:lysophospholipase L1-like esterase/dienelactone hydrolase